MSDLLRLMQRQRLLLHAARSKWKSRPPNDRYHVGETSENPMTTMEEDGCQDTSMILRGFTRKDRMILKHDAETIRMKCPLTEILPDGTGIAIFYNGASFVPTGDAELKSIKINLLIKEWRVN